MTIKKTKLICTIGPASESREMLQDMMQAGMNAARLNFSHGSYPEHKARMDLIKSLRAELNLPIAVILDTKGPEIRTGKFAGSRVELRPGQQFRITTRECVGSQERCSTSYHGITGDVKKGDRILIDDGLIEMNVDEVSQEQIVCTVNNGGEIKDHKSINLPGVSVNLPALSEKDKEDLRFGIQEEVDFVAASFIRKAQDVRDIRQFLAENGGGQIRIISKIENMEGVDHIDEIIEESDGVMVARGDLGVEIPPQQVPVIQKRIIRKCNVAGKPVITATQMMDSMIRNPRPTRAEVADVANAIFDGTDVVMLSGETAAGKYPLEAVEMMTDVSLTTEAALDYEKIQRKIGLEEGTSVTTAIGYATCSSADSLGARAIIIPTTTGYTAAIISRYRPQTPIIAFSGDEKVVRSLSLNWGVRPHHLANINEENEFFRQAVNRSKKEKYIVDGDLIVLTAGIPLGIGGTTNMMRIHTVGQPF